MKGLFVLSLIIAVVAAGNWNSNDRNNRRLTERDAKHQKFILDLLRHLQNDIHQKDFMQYSNTIRLDNKSDYKDLNKVYHFVSLFRNGLFVQRNQPFSLMRERNVITTKALFDFFDTMNDWNTVAINLIWARRNINEYQFWHLITLLVTHNRHFSNLVLPSFYEVLPNQFFTADVMDQAVNTRWNLEHKGKFVIMSNYTTGVLGSNDDDNNDNVYDLNDIKHQNNKITDWNTLKKVMYDIKNQLKLNNYNNRLVVDRKNKDIKNKIDNNNRNLNQGNKFDNNGEDRMVYFTEDIGLNNYYYFSRIANFRIVDNKQMYNNDNNKDNFNMKNGQIVNSHEADGKIYRRGERYVYQMKQLLARYNLERKSNGLDNVQDMTLDGTIDNGVYPNLRFTNGLQMTNRQNDYNLKKQHNMRLIQVTKDFENRFYQAVDQGFVETVDGRKVNLQTKEGINILGNLLQGNRDSVNNQYYRYLEYYYRLLFGGNNNDNVDFTDNRFMPTVLDNYETSMRDSVFWQIVKRITNIVTKFQNKLIGYKTRDVDFEGVKINSVKVDKLLTYFNYFDADITNGINGDLINNRMCGNNRDNSGSFESNESIDSGNDSSDSDSSESNSYEHVFFKNDMTDRRDTFGRVDRDNKNWNGQRNFNKNHDKHDNRRNLYKKNHNERRNHFENSHSDESSSSESDSNDSRNSGSNEMRGKQFVRNYRNGDRYNKNYDNKNFKNHVMNKNYNRGSSQQFNYWNRYDNTNTMHIFGRTRRMDTKQFTVSIDVNSKKSQHGIVRIFLGTRINNKQQLNDNRKNFVELDQFVVKLSQGNNLIKRNSRDFKNVVGDSESFGTLYRRTLNTLNNGGKNGGGNDLNNLNFDTLNNNRGFPHRLLLPKGTVNGEDYTLFIVVSDLDNTNFNHVMYDNNMKTRGIDFTGNSNVNSHSDESSTSNDSNDSGSGELRNNKDYKNKHFDNMDRNMNDMYGHGKNFEHNVDNKNWYRGNDNKNLNDYNTHRYGNDFTRNGKGGNWYGKNNDNGMTIHNFNNGNKNVGNGNGVLDNRAMGFPLDRQIIDVNGFITNNMFFKDVKIFHMDMDNKDFRNFNNDDY